MFDEIYSIPLTDHIKMNKKAKPYEKMSRFAKDVHDARKMGMTYGKYMAYKQGPMPHKSEVVIDGKVYIE